MIYNSNETINNAINSIIELAHQDQEKAFDACEEGFNYDELKKIKRLYELEDVLETFDEPKQYIRKLIQFYPNYVNKFNELNKDNTSAMLFVDKVMTQYRYYDLVHMFKF